MTHTEALTRAGVPDAAAADILALVDGGLSLGVAVWQLLPGQRGQTDYHALPGWPQCHCSRPATREDALPLWCSTNCSSEV